MEIKINDYLIKDSIFLGVKGKDKKTVLASILDHLIAKNKIKKQKKKEILKMLIQREEMGSTAIGGHISLPHARIDSIPDIRVCLAISHDGVDFDSLDQEPVYIIALLLSNSKEAGLHLKMLAFIARLLRDKPFVQRLRLSKSEKEILELINKQAKLLI